MKNKICITLLLVLSIIFGGLIIMDDSVDKELFAIGTVFACYDGCFNMISVYNPTAEMPYNYSLREKYDGCAVICGEHYLDDFYN